MPSCQLRYWVLDGRGGGQTSSSPLIQLSVTEDSLLGISLTQQSWSYYEIQRGTMPDRSPFVSRSSWCGSLLDQQRLHSPPYHTPASPFPRRWWRMCWTRNETSSPELTATPEPSVSRWLAVWSGSTNQFRDLLGPTRRELNHDWQGEMPTVQVTIITIVI